MELAEILGEKKEVGNALNQRNLSRVHLYHQPFFSTQYQEERILASVLRAEASLNIVKKYF
jgi:hypothetical protein